jgi:hypothetical protein
MRPEQGLVQPAPQAWGLQPAWFVYYRVHPQNLEHAVLAVQQQQQCLRGVHPGLQAALMRRSDTDPAHVTLMEIYVAPGANGGLPSPALAQAIEATMAGALQGLMQGPRHTEEFLPCA